MGGKGISLSLRVSLWVTGFMGILGFGLILYAGRINRQEALETARFRMQSAGQTQASAIQKRFEAGMDAARTLAQVLAANHGGRQGFTRDQVNVLLRRVLAENPDFLGTYTIWEPQAFDGRDAAYAGRRGHDRTGRLIPYWSRSPLGVIQAEPVTGYETPGEGEFYLQPRRTGQETLLEPYLYPVQGEPVLMASMVVPIVDGGRFKGVAGVDLRVDFLQKLADGMDIYDGAGKVILLTNRGTIAASTGRPDVVGRPGVEPGRMREFRDNLEVPGSRVLERDGFHHAFTPITVGRTVTPWAVITRVPEKVIMAAADRHIRMLTLAGLAIITLSTVLAIVLLRRLFVTRILALCEATGRLAAGELDTRCPVTGNDELSQLGNAFNLMAASLGDSIRGLRDNRLLLSAVLDNAYQMYGLLTPDGLLLSANRSALAMVDQPLDSIQGQPLWKLPWWRHDAGEREKVRQAVREASQGSLARFETTHLDAIGDLHWVDFSLTPLRDEHQRIQFLIAEGRDVSEHRRAEEEHLKVLSQLHHSQKMDAVGQLAGGIAHDFNNVLGGIMGAGELLRAKDTTEAYRERYVALILSAARRAADLVGKLLTFSRRNAKASTPVDLAAIAREAIDILRGTLDKRIHITLANTARSSQVIGDDTMLQGALLNLGINASHAMPEGGELAFHVRNVDLDAIYCGASPFDLRPGPFVELEVRDTGCGMPPEVMGRIFEPFFTTKGPGEGTGLGLAAVYGTIQGHRGAITVYSEVGTGTAFHLYLPAAGEVVERRSGGPRPPIRGNATILLVDDEEIIRLTASRLLEDLGYRVLTAADGAQGLDALQKARTPVDLVILDMIMPVMGGRETFARLCEVAPGLPVILSSGFSKDEDLVEMRRLGLRGFLRKPFQLDELSRTVAEALS